MSNYKKINKLFNKNGFAVLKNFISIKLIDEIKNETEKLIKNRTINNQMRDIHYLKTGQLSSVHNIVNYMPKYKKFGSHSKLYDVFDEGTDDDDSVALGFKPIYQVFTNGMNTIHRVQLLRRILNATNFTSTRTKSVFWVLLWFPL